MKQYIDPFVQVCTAVFKEMFNCDSKPDRAYFAGKETFLDWDISGVIALTGGVQGMVAISMKYSTAAKITGILAETTAAVSSTEMIDAVGELVNIIAGNVKKNLEDLFRITISLPKVVYGKAHSVVIPDERLRMLCIPFLVFEEEIICLSININET
ncbi:MAG: chemotaxis protein CheX [Spirochaetaceae bacterium]|jgi:chemotaxis protein CheX|nr:chemotaxis protein CheX [Spirochaetaceae bacterium]